MPRDVRFGTKSRNVFTRFGAWTQEACLTEDQRKDRRVEKTERLLHDALSSLIHEKTYDEIVVKEILARANVGRSTFYAHFRDKDELLVTGIRDMVGARAVAPPPSTAPVEHILRFSLPILRHIATRRQPNAKAGEPGRQRVVHDHLRDVLAELVARDLETIPGRLETASGVSRELLAQHVAATFVLVLEWWTARGCVLSAVEANDAFRALVMPVVSRALQ